MKQLLRLLRLIILVGAMGVAWAQQKPATSLQLTANDTKLNQRDRNQNEPTADQQKGNDSDVALAQ